MSHGDCVGGQIPVSMWVLEASCGAGHVGGAAMDGGWQSEHYGMAAWFAPGLARARLTRFMNLEAGVARGRYHLHEEQGR